MQCIGKILLSFSLLVWAQLSFAAWPVLPFPPNASVEAIGKDVRLNGIPMRMHRILSSQDTASMLEFYRQSLGDKHAEARFSGGVLLSQGKGDYFITVRIRALSPKLTETLLSVSDARADKKRVSMPLGFNLPAGSVLTSDMESKDVGKISRQLVFNNKHAVNTNADYLTKALQAKGYHLQPQFVNDTAYSKTLMFDGDQREAQIAIVRQQGGSNVVLTMLETLVQ